LLSLLLGWAETIIDRENSNTVVIIGAILGVAVVVRLHRAAAHSSV
jgi:hypothetical protein